MSPEGQQVLVGEYLEAPLEGHPIANVFPMLPDEEIKELSRDIEEKGLRSPIMIHEGKILDGRNRYQAIKRMSSWTGKLDLWWLTKYPGPDPYEYVVSMNCHRRHLTTGQRSAIAEELATLKHGQRADKAEASIEASTQREAAKSARVNVHSYSGLKPLKRRSRTPLKS